MLVWVSLSRCHSPSLCVYVNRWLLFSSQCVQFLSRCFVSLLFYSLKKYGILFSFFCSSLFFILVFARVTHMQCCSQAGCRRRTNSTKYIFYGLVYKNFIYLSRADGVRWWRRAPYYRSEDVAWAYARLLTYSFFVTQTSKQPPASAPQPVFIHVYIDHTLSEQQCCCCVCNDCVCLLACERTCMWASKRCLPAAMETTAFNSNAKKRIHRDKTR